MQIRIVTSKATAAEEVREATVVVCSYSQLCGAAEAIAARRFRVCVADESAPPALLTTSTPPTLSSRPVLVCIIFRKTLRPVLTCPLHPGHYLKEFKSQRTKAATPILKEARHCILLSGTPILNRPSEALTQARVRLCA